MSIYLLKPKTRIIKMTLNKFIMFFLGSFVLINSINSQDFYDIDTINTIELTFQESNWDYLLDQLYAEGKKKD